MTSRQKQCNDNNFHSEKLANLWYDGSYSKGVTLKTKKMLSYNLNNNKDYFMKNTDIITVSYHIFMMFQFTEAYNYLLDLACHLLSRYYLSTNK